MLAELHAFVDGISRALLNNCLGLASTPSVEDILTQFSSDGGISTLFVSCVGEAEASLSLILPPIEQKSIAFIKTKNSSLNSNAAGGSLHNQLQVMTLQSQDGVIKPNGDNQLTAENVTTSDSARSISLSNHVGEIELLNAKGRNDPTSIDNMNVSMSLLQVLHRYTKCVFVPIVHSAVQQANDNATAAISSSSIALDISGREVDKSPAVTLVAASTANISQTVDELSVLQRRVRDFELALESCQREADIPHISLTIPIAVMQAVQEQSSVVTRITTAQWNDVLTQGLSQSLSSRVGDDDARGHVFRLLGIAKVDSEIPQDLLVSAVQAATAWTFQLKQLVTLVPSVALPTSIDREISLWIALESACSNAMQQFEEEGCVVTRILLQQGNPQSYKELHSIGQDLISTSKVVTESAVFLRDLPVSELVTAANLYPKLTVAATLCLKHFSKLKTLGYDYSRALRLLDLVGALVATRMIALINEQNILMCASEDLSTLRKDACDVVDTWETQLTAQRFHLKDVAKMHGARSLPTHCEQLVSIKLRVIELCEFREKHDSFVSVCSKMLLGKGDHGNGQSGTGLDEVLKAFHAVGSVCANASRNGDGVLDLTTAGAQAWNAARAAYERKVEVLEKHFITALTDRLQGAQSVDAMFAEFNACNTLLYRPAIRNAVQPFRLTLMATVQKDLQRLQDKFKMKYDTAAERQLAALGDIPPLAGRLLWAKQIEQHLTKLLQRMSSVLGMGWETQLEGKQLQTICDELRSNLDIENLYSEWISVQLKSDITRYQKTKDFPLLVMERPHSGHRYLHVNFEMSHLQLCKEVSYLEHLLPTLGLSASRKIPPTIVAVAQEARLRYPLAQRLQAAVSLYTQCTQSLSVDARILLAARVTDVREVIKEVFGGTKRSQFRWVKWVGTPSVDEWISHLTSTCHVLKQSTYEVVKKLEEIDKLLNTLATCPYESRALNEVISEIQEIVDLLQMRGYCDIAVWMKRLNIQVEHVLVTRLKQVLQQWTLVFQTNATSTLNSRASEVLGMPPPVLEMRISGECELQVIPTLEQTRTECLTNLQSNLDIVLCLPRLASTRYQVSAAQNSDYAHLLGRIKSADLMAPALAVQRQLLDAHLHIQSWLQYQALWGITVAAVRNHLKSDLQQWIRIVNDIQTARKLVENASENVFFGPVVIAHRQAQSKVIEKFEQLLFQCSQALALLTAEQNRIVLSDLVDCKKRLEVVELAGTTGNALQEVSCVLQAQQTVRDKQLAVDLLLDSERLLKRQRHDFPLDWMSAANTLSLLTEVSTLLDIRSHSMTVQLPLLRERLLSESANVEEQAATLLQSWASNRPSNGRMEPGAAMQVLGGTETRVAELLVEAQRVELAQKAMNVPLGQTLPLLLALQKEVSCIKTAWAYVVLVRDRLNSFRVQHVSSVKPDEIAQMLELEAHALLQQSEDIRSSECVVYLHEQLLLLQNYQPLLKEMHSAELQDRHWRELADIATELQSEMKQALQSPRAPALTLGQFWAMNPIAHRKRVLGVIAKAQGEQALQRFFADVREHWRTQELSIAMRSGIQIVSGWEQVFTALEDHLGSISSLKLSPYYQNVPEFIDEAQSWESRLTALKAVLVLWAEVQRKWVYLRGVFKNADLLIQLPAQHAKFKTMDVNFLALIQRVASKPIALELLAISSLSVQLERHETVLSSIQKALSDCLETQRQVFPRFYFVNNDDLVEIIGSSRDPAKVMLHLSKLFAGVSSLRTIEETLLSSDNSSQNIQSIENSAVMATAIVSKEGEELELGRSVALTTTSVKEWLVVLESQMQSSLQALLLIALVNQYATNNALSSSSSGAELESLFLYKSMPSETIALLRWVTQYPGQVVLLAEQISWCMQIEIALTLGKTLSNGIDPTAALQSNLQKLQSLLEHRQSRISALSGCISAPLTTVLRKKCEQVLTDAVQLRDVLRVLLETHVESMTDFGWLCRLRYYSRSGETSSPQSYVEVQMANASFRYGYEYLGLRDMLVQTPLTDRCYLTLTQALHLGLGANPFGPAGTGKTESVKNLGAQLGRLVLVFNCDSTFDYAAMGRIFAGLCRVGAWGCFDEFNRLEERILSAVSQQILAIQRALLMRHTAVDLLGTSCTLQPSVGIFVTLNPGYAGRSNLPDNLKQLFRSVAMARPDSRLIAQVTLFSQGLLAAETLAQQIVTLFALCDERLSRQRHYDFGLRALKSVLVGAGELKRTALLSLNDDMRLSIAGSDAVSAALMADLERQLLIRSTCDNIVPKLVADDVTLFASLLRSVFPDSEDNSMLTKDTSMLVFNSVLEDICKELNYQMSSAWKEKVCQLYHVMRLRHGVMLVGPSATGKSSAWRALLAVLQRLEGSKGEFIIIDPKSIAKEHLFGTLDPHTLEWKDGIFTKIVRRISAAEEAFLAESTSTGSEGKTSPTNAGNKNNRVWIVFDGDCDPEWAENLNSVLDDNRLLTLPSGDRIKIPDRIRILFEVDSLRHATLATVSRCGMVWFPEGTVPLSALLHHRFLYFQQKGALQIPFTESHRLAHTMFCALLQPYWSETGLVSTALTKSIALPSHLTGVCLVSMLEMLHSLLLQGIIAIAESFHVDNWSTTDTSDVRTAPMASFMHRWFLYSVLWAFSSSVNNIDRLSLARFLISHVDVVREPAFGVSGMKAEQLVSCCPSVDGAGWSVWQKRSDVQLHSLSAARSSEAAGDRVHDETMNVVVPTAEGLQLRQLIQSYLTSQLPFILCGPLGSGKSTAIRGALQTLSQLVLVNLYFTRATTPELLHLTFADHGEVVETANGLVLRPNKLLYQNGEKLLFCCVDMNLTHCDAYDTQLAIALIRQLMEHGGYWDQKCRWVRLQDIQFCGICHLSSNIPSLALPARFMRHVAVVQNAIPTESSLLQICCFLLQKVLAKYPLFVKWVDALGAAMVQIYRSMCTQFTAIRWAHYLFSPADVSAWIRALQWALLHADLSSSDMTSFLSLWLFTGHRVFLDKLVSEDEKKWAEARIQAVAFEQLHACTEDLVTSVQQSRYLSPWLHQTKAYRPATHKQLEEFLKERLKVFYEEELNVPLVVFDEVIDHVSRLDLALRLHTPKPHFLLVGESGVGKSVLSRFAAWINGLKVFQLKASASYTLDKFHADLRGLLMLVGVEHQRMCFLIDESNLLSVSFQDKINSLLASGEVPGLFTGEERVQLLAAYKESLLNMVSKETSNTSSSSTSGVGRSEDVSRDDHNLWKSFCQTVQRNLHVIITMNPSSDEFVSRCAAAPALLRCCKLDWFGTWSRSALAQVAWEFTSECSLGLQDLNTQNKQVDKLSLTHYNPPTDQDLTQSDSFSGILMDVLSTLNVSIDQMTLRHALVAALVTFQHIANTYTEQEDIANTIASDPINVKSQRVTPRDILDLIKHFVALEREKRERIEEQQTHLRNGLLKLHETQSQVAVLRQQMVLQEELLNRKEKEANTKLAQMIDGQREAEAGKAVAEALTVEIEKQNANISERKAVAERELQDAEPALRSAKESVSNIRRAQLDEIRALTRPPEKIQWTLEMVAIMIGEQDLNWTELRKVIRRDDFISIVANFDPSSLDVRAVSKVKSEYLYNPRNLMDYDSVDRASKACGPLFLWAQSQIHYAEILTKIQPLRDEVADLSAKSKQLEAQQQNAIKQVSDLQNSILEYKLEYASCVRSSESIRSEIEIVQKKVKRAEALMASLLREQERWQGASESYDRRKETLLGDALLGAAFLTYSGALDHRGRLQLLSQWAYSLQLLRVPSQGIELDLVQYLSTPQQQMSWQSHGLPDDSISAQNALLMHRFQRFSFVIDPSGQATTFLRAKYASAKVSQCSARDKHFMKTLISAIRFGSILFVQDAEVIDALLYPILNREVQRVSGRLILRIGSEEVDYSPQFSLFLITRNPKPQLTPDLRSRVTVVNFCITQSSLEAQSLEAILRSERPDLQERRIELLHLLTSQATKLRDLEEALLHKISAAPGAILDDDSVLLALERIKADAAHLTTEVLQTEVIIKDVKSSASVYEPMATAMAAVYFTLAALSRVFPVYQFSLPYFLKLLQEVLDAHRQYISSDVARSLDSTQRLKSMSNTFFAMVCSRLSSSLKEQDKLLLRIRLACIAADAALPAGADPAVSQAEQALLWAEWQPSLDSNPLAQRFVNIFGSHRSPLDINCATALTALVELPVFHGLANAMASSENYSVWANFIDAADAEYKVPLQLISTINLSETSPIRRAMLDALIVKAIRPDCLIAALERFTCIVFGSEAQAAWHRQCSSVDIPELIKNRSSATCPMLVCSSAGYDPSARLESISLTSIVNSATNHTKPMLQVSMGSAEGFVDAERYVSQAALTGHWVLLRNIHLCPEWLTQLDLLLQTLTPHADFRLLLTASLTSVTDLPLSLVRRCEVAIIEARAGVKANLVRFWSQLSPARIEHAPVLRARLYGLLGWLHAVVQERARYLPLGWSKRYDFNESDVTCGLSMIDSWVESAMNAAANCDKPFTAQTLPWKAMQALLSHSIYGARIDCEIDQQMLKTTVEQLFCSETCQPRATLIASQDCNTTGENDMELLRLPDELSATAFEQWMQALPDHNSPTWIGLSSKAEQQMHVTAGQELLARWVLIS